MRKQYLTTKIFEKAKAAGWNVVLTEIAPPHTYQVVATHEFGFERNYAMLAQLVPTEDQYLKWLMGCAQNLEKTAVPIANQDLMPKYFFTKWAPKG